MPSQAEIEVAAKAMYDRTVNPEAGPMEVHRADAEAALEAAEKVREEARTQPETGPYEAECCGDIERGDCCGNPTPAGPNPTQADLDYLRLYAAAEERHRIVALIEGVAMPLYDPDGNIDEYHGAAGMKRRILTAIQEDTNE